MKNNLNPLAVAEQTLAHEIRSLPEVSGLFGDVETGVLAASQEDFGEKLASLLESSLGAGIVVSCTGTKGDVWRNDACGMSDVARFRVEIKTSLLMASERRQSATDLSDVIVAALDGEVFEEPFFPDGVLFAGMDVADFEDFSRIVTLNFEARILLKPNH